MKIIKRTVILAIASLLLLSCTNVFAVESEIDEIQYFEDVIKYVQENYNYDVEDKELYKSAILKILEKNPDIINNAVEGVFNSLDQHSTYFYEDDFKEFTLGVQGKFTGVGVVITSKDGYITVVSPIEDSPAYKAGLKTGDKIIYVDDLNIEGYNLDKAAMLLRGEKGTKVNVKILRGEKILSFKLTRDLVKINPISYKIIDDEIGYIRITSFNSNASEFMIKALNDFEDKDIKKLIIDVRNNPGGQINEALKISSIFVPKNKTIVNIKNKEKTNNLVSRSDRDNDNDIIVLINEGSASAAEIFAAALKDNNIAKLVGVKSFGKGTIQQTLPLKIGGGIKLTISEFYTPNDKRINEVGIKPDYSVENTTEKVNTDNLEKLVVNAKYNVGSDNKNVFAAEQRLNLLGYDVGEPDNYYDKKTFEAVKEFQSSQNLYPYGVLDYTTQGKLKDVVSSLEYVIDLQLKKAIELLK